MLPNFFLIGAPKSGTTALWHYLRQHPQLFMSERKEPRYFAFRDDSVRLNGPGDRESFEVMTREQYESLFDDAGDATAIGEASQWYFYVESAVPEILRAVPHAKLIVVLRDPAERAFSNYLHARRERLEPCARFGDAIDAEADRIRAGWSPRFHYVAKGFYHQQLSRCYRHVDRERLRVYFYEDLQRDAAALMCDMFEFLDVDPQVPLDTSARHNESVLPRSEFVERIVNSKRIGRTMTKLVTAPAWLRIENTVRRLNTAPRPTLSSTDRARLIDLYHDDVRALEVLTGRDLSSWLTVDRRIKHTRARPIPAAVHQQPIKARRHS
jgi:hypothetical protein